MTKTPPQPRRRSRIAHFKAPFVISVAGTGVFGLACGGEVASASPEPTSLTSESPEPGSACDEQTLPLESSDGCPAPECIDGQWVFTSCNPPPIELDCSAPPPDPLPGVCSVPAECVNGEWLFPDVSCNPPPPPQGCPAELPTAGDSCADEASGLTCEYEFCYAIVPMVTCNAGVWEALLQPPCNPPPPPCFDDFSCGEESGDAGAPPGTDAAAPDAGG